MLGVPLWTLCHDSTGVFHPRQDAFSNDALVPRIIHILKTVPCWCYASMRCFSPILQAIHHMDCQAGKSAVATMTAAHPDVDVHMVQDD